VSRLLQGVIMQSLDVLDFSVIHLSAYERSSHKHRYWYWYWYCTHIHACASSYPDFCRS
jgi:hypothetical protein